MNFRNPNIPTEVINIKLDREFPDVFYIGAAKTGSRTICEGLKESFTIHCHGTDHFRKIYEHEPIPNGNILEFIPEIYKNVYKKPLIVESIRDPIARRISQSHFENEEATYDELYDLFKDIDWFADNTISCHSALWPRYFNVSSSDVYVETEAIKLLMLKFEDMKNWAGTFEMIGYNFTPNHANEVKHEPYLRMKKDFKLPRDILNELYEHPIITTFYSKYDIELLKLKWEE
jgi:hypothetical protein|tara:strand:- start:1045 stop:1740 length:696 start_codon:yes stop_codon:yes gene_type:complete